MGMARPLAVLISRACRPSSSGEQAMNLSRYRVLGVVGALAVLAAGLLPDVPATAALLAKSPQAKPMVAELIGETVVLPDADRQAIRAVIERQLQAFLRDDGTAAFSYATPNI